jgi:hypothetical protein
MGHFRFVHTTNKRTGGEAEKKNQATAFLGEECASGCCESGLQSGEMISSIPIRLRLGLG